MTIIIANWKMNKGLEGSLDIATDLHNLINKKAVNCQVVLCPSFPYLYVVSKIISNGLIKLGAQDCSFKESGAYTGDVSASMLKDSGCDYVILGHSERRLYHNETSSVIKQKAEKALLYGLTAIICVGETSLEKEKGKAFSVIEDQLKNSLPLSLSDENIIIAYEPVWAIGTGKNPSVREINKVHAHIKDCVKDFIALHGLLLEKDVKIVYGGSVNPSNCKEILSIANVNGLLVGGASLVSKDFYNILIEA
jgi:triosephosphate isomerase